MYISAVQAPSCLGKITSAHPLPHFRPYSAARFFKLTAAQSTRQPRELSSSVINVCEADDLLSFIHSSSIRVEYSRSFEYCLKFKGAMNTQSSSRSPQGSSPAEEVIIRRWRGKRLSTWLKKTEEGDGTDEGKSRDMIDIINSITEDDEGKFVEVTDGGVDESDEDRRSVSSSIASGPSYLHVSSPKKATLSEDLCSACRARYQKAKRMKAPIKNKLLDDDPKSLTCDQWVLMKKWRPRRLPNATGKLMSQVQLVKQRLEVKNGASVEESSPCSRLHTFLHRNLRRRVKKTRRKRSRDGFQGPRVAKQPRLHSNDHSQLISSSGCSGSPGFEGCGDESDTNLTVELFPSTTELDSTKLNEAPPEQKAPQKMGGLRGLLAQLRGNSSMIVRETP